MQVKHTESWTARASCLIVSVERERKAQANSDIDKSKADFIREGLTIQVKVLDECILTALFVSLLNRDRFLGFCKIYFNGEKRQLKWQKKGNRKIEHNEHYLLTCMPLWS